MSNKKTTWVCNGRRRTGLETEPCSLANDCTFQVSGSYVPVGCTIFGNDTDHFAEWTKQEGEADSETGKFQEYLVPPAIDFTDESVRLNFYKGSCASLGLPCAYIDCYRCILGADVPASLRNDYIEARGYPRVLIKEPIEDIAGSGYCKDMSSAVIDAAQWLIDREHTFTFSEDESKFEDERAEHIDRIRDNLTYTQLAALVLDLALYSSEFKDCLKHIQEMES